MLRTIRVVGVNQQTAVRHSNQRSAVCQLNQPTVIVRVVVASDFEMRVSS
jgi:hypothetical protein